MKRHESAVIAATALWGNDKQQVQTLRMRTPVRARLRPGSHINKEVSVQAQLTKYCV